jgi:hypothetical protein
MTREQEQRAVMEIMRATNGNPEERERRLRQLADGHGLLVSHEAGYLTIAGRPCPGGLMCRCYDRASGEWSCPTHGRMTTELLRALIEHEAGCPICRPPATNS